MITKVREFFRYKCWSKRPSIEIRLENYGQGGYVKIDGHIIPVTHIAFDGRDTTDKVA